MYGRGGRWATSSLLELPAVSIQRNKATNKQAEQARKRILFSNETRWDKSPQVKLLQPMRELPAILSLFQRITRGAHSGRDLPRVSGEEQGLRANKGLLLR